MSALIQANDLSFFRQNRQVLDHISLTIEPNSITTLIGPNGAGKSTLIKILMGIQKPDSGTVTSKSDLRIGYMPQRLHIDDSLPMSVLRLLSLPHPIDHEKACQALAMTGVDHLINAPVQKLSGGEFQRVLLARALVREPDVLVLDEPVQGVDFTGEAELYQLIENLQEQTGCAVLMVSHDLHIVLAKSDQVICLNHHVCCSGTPDTVQHHPEFIQLFGQHAPSIGFYTHKHDHDHSLDEQGHQHG